MSRRKAHLVITCDGCAEVIDRPHGCYIYEVLPPSITGNVESESLDFCRMCHDRLYPALESLRKPEPVKPSWWSRFFGGSHD